MFAAEGGLCGRVKINHQKCRGILVFEGTFNITFHRELEEEMGYLVRSKQIRKFEKETESSSYVAAEFSDVELCGVVHRLFQGVPDFQNAICFIVHLSM
jgi:hypothetical protein